MSEAKTDGTGFFYDQRHDRTLYSARKILSYVSSHIGPLTSVLDVGCGVGTWLSVAHEMGSVDICGMDGAWVDSQHLIISKENFVCADLNKTFNFDKCYQLAICLEVAEHLDPDVAKRLVDDLCRSAGYVLFSAAIPGQEGVGHINEQWPAYWSKLFQLYGYEPFDDMRLAFWNDDAIPYWYRQNMVLYKRIGQDVSRRDEDHSIRVPLALIHPELYESKRHDLMRWDAYRRSPGMCLKWFLAACKQQILHVTKCGRKQSR